MLARVVEVADRTGSPDDHALVTDESRALWLELRLISLDRGRVASGGIALGGGRSLDLWADPVKSHCHTAG